MPRASFDPSDRKAFVTELRSHSRSGVIARKTILQVARDRGFDPILWLINNPKFRVSSGVIDLNRIEEEDLDASQRRPRATPLPRRTPSLRKPVVLPEQQDPEMVAAAGVISLPTIQQKRLQVEVDNLVPRKDDTFVPFGFYRELCNVLATGLFYPIYITGLSGNGKTKMVEQACAALGREFIRVNITIETDEDDLIGGYTLVDGNLVYREGPVILAMRRGAVLCLDEFDRGSNKLMCLQPILEGSAYFIKKTGQVVHPADGFTVVATANTKGRGSDDGKYMAAQMQDDALHERFALTVEHDFPPIRVEKRILINKMHREGKVDEEFATHLVKWSETVREAYKQNAVQDLISTRRLEHIVKAFAIFDDRMKAIQYCISRFDTETKLAFMDLYTRLDASTTMPKKEEEETDVND